MLRRLKHGLLGHDFYAAYVANDGYRTEVGFVCKCGARNKLILPGHLTLHPGNAKDSELEELKKMAGLS